MSALSLLAVLAGCNAGNPGAALGSGTVAPAASPVGVVQGTCPAITLRDGTASFRTYARGGQDDPAKVVYQASLVETTRACTRSETAMTITVMVQGRLVAGPLGTAGTLSMPMRVEVTVGEQVLYSEVSKFDASLADVGQATQFVFTKNVTVPSGISNFAKVYVGFEQASSKKK